MPVENHVEQQVNALDAQQFGIAIADTSFNLDRLAELPDRLPVEKISPVGELRAGKAFCRHRPGRKIFTMIRENILQFPAGFLSYQDVADAGGRPYRKRMDVFHCAGWK